MNRAEVSSKVGWKETSGAKVQVVDVSGTKVKVEDSKWN